MLEFKVKLSQNLEDLLDRYPMAFGEAMVSALDDWQLLIDREMQLNLEGRNLKRRTGHLAQGLNWVSVRREGSNFVMELESKAPYAAIQEHGGVIKPKKAKYLTVPLPAALTPAGVLRKEAREYPNAFIQRSRRGNLIIFDQRGNKIVPLFVLKKEVKIPPSHWFSDAVNRVDNELVQILAIEVDRRIGTSG